MDDLTEWNVLVKAPTLMDAVAWFTVRMRPHFFRYVGTSLISGNEWRVTFLTDKTEFRYVRTHLNEWLVDDVNLDTVPNGGLLHYSYKPYEPLVLTTRD